MSRAELVWSKEDVSFLISNYNLMTAIELQERFPKRSLDAIRKKARKYGLCVEKSMEFINRSNARQGEKGSNWKGGKRTTAKGYIQVLQKGHPRADPSGYVMEHIYVWETETGIKVPDGFVVHHLDGNKRNNDISNLCLMKNGAHSSYHNRLRHLRKKEKKC